MENDIPKVQTAENGDDAAHGEASDDAAANTAAAAGSGSAVGEDDGQEPPPPVVEEPCPEPGGDGEDEDGAAEEPPAKTKAEQVENQIQQRVDESPAATLNAISGNNAKLYNTNIYNSPTDKPRDLASYISKSSLPPARRSYKSVGDSEIAGYAGVLLTQRILLLGCRNKIVALNVAKSIAHEIPNAGKQLVTVKANCEGTYSAEDLIRQLAAHKESDGQGEGRSSRRRPNTVWVWEANDVSEGEISDISDTILDSLFLSSGHLDQYQALLSESGLYLICLIPPQKLQDYKRSNFEVDLQSWEIDFLRPFLEEYELGGAEELAETIVGQRRQEKWSADDAGFYREIGNHLRARNLPAVVADKARGDYLGLDVEQLFDRQDLLADTVLYCATYYPDLSPQDFLRLVNLLLDEATEDVDESKARPRDGDEVPAPPPPLTRRWERESDAILRRCKLAALTAENNKRVVDFQVDGLRSRLSRYIRNDHYFFYESKFALMRRQGHLFNPRKKIAEGARQLLVEMATQYAPGEVASWLYEIVYEFEQAAQAADLYSEHSQLFHLLPKIKVTAARRYVCHGLSLVLNRLDKDPDLQEAARLFWLKLLQTQKQWFLDLLRQMGNSTPAETLGWLKQVLEQGGEIIRNQAQSYLLGYLLRRDSLVYPTLEELKQWPSNGKAGRVAQMLLIVYCVETNRRVPQQDYGRWPSAHPLFAFQNIEEARTSLKFLLDWLFDAAFEVAESDGLSVVADIIAGWYFILTPPPPPADGEEAGAGELDSRSVRRLLLECLALRCSRPEKSGLLDIWEEFRSRILAEVARFEQLTDYLVEMSASYRLMKDAAGARRKMLNTRSLVGELRKDFRRCTVEVVNG